jgi:uncharacterized membrane protein
LKIAEKRKAVTEGFEPSVPLSEYVGLANRWFQPLTHVTCIVLDRLFKKAITKVIIKLKNPNLSSQIFFLILETKKKTGKFLCCLKVYGFIGLVVYPNFCINP